jgi:hypothetical protein
MFYIAKIRSFNPETGRYELSDVLAFGADGMSAPIRVFGLEDESVELWIEEVSD